MAVQVWSHRVVSKILFRSPNYNYLQLKLPPTKTFLQQKFTARVTTKFQRGIRVGPKLNSGALISQSSANLPGHNIQSVQPHSLHFVKSSKISITMLTICHQVYGINLTRSSTSWTSPNVPKSVPKKSHPQCSGL